MKVKILNDCLPNIGRGQSFVQAAAKGDRRRWTVCSASTSDNDLVSDCNALVALNGVIVANECDKMFPTWSIVPQRRL